MPGIGGLFGGGSGHDPVAAMADAAAARAQADISTLVDRVRALETDLERMRTVVEALWNVVRERNGLDGEALRRAIEHLDLADGVADGRRTRSGPTPCPRCGRPAGARQANCMYCDEPIPRDVFGR